MRYDGRKLGHIILLLYNKRNEKKKRKWHRDIEWRLSTWKAWRLTFSESM